MKAYHGIYFIAYLFLLSCAIIDEQSFEVALPVGVIQLLDRSAILLRISFQKE